MSQWINSAEVYEDAGMKAGRGARNHDAGLVRHWREWLRRALALESAENRKEIKAVYDAAYSKQATPTMRRFNPALLSDRDFMDSFFRKHFLAYAKANGYTRQEIVAAWKLYQSDPAYLADKGWPSLFESVKKNPHWPMSRRVVIKGDKFKVARFMADNGIPFAFESERGGNTIGRISLQFVERVREVLAAHPEYEGRFAKHVGGRVKKNPVSDPANEASARQLELFADNTAALQRNPRGRSLKALQKSASESAKFRGHTLGKWYGIASRKSAWAACVYCGKTVFIDKSPPPNGIDISGEAVALNCESARKELAEPFRDGGSASRFDAGGSLKRNPVSDPANEASARELELFADNTAALQGQRNSIIVNLARKLANGTYDNGKAPKLWEYWFESAAKLYAKEFSVGTDWHTIFNKRTRELAARSYAIPMLTMLMDGEFDHLLKGVNAKRMAAKRASGEYRQPINPPLKNPAALSKNCPHCGAFATRCAGDEPRRHAMICKVTGKVLKKWPAKPRGGFVIVARSKAGPARTLYYTKKHRRFSDDPKDRPTVYPNTAIAHATGLKLLKHYSILDRHTVTVEPVAGRGAKKNPDPGWYVWGGYTSVAFFATKAEAEAEAKRMNYRGGQHYTVRAADDLTQRGMGSKGSSSRRSNPDYTKKHRFSLTLNEKTGHYWINDSVTGKSYETLTSDHATAKQELEAARQAVTEKEAAADDLTQRGMGSKGSSSRRSNPAAAFVIVIQANNKRLTFDANRRRFTDNSKPSLYATANTAQERGLELLKKYPKLRGYKMTVESAILPAYSRRKNPGKRELSVFDRHRKKIALDTLKMSDVGARIMGGMTKAEAIEFLQTIGYRFPSGMGSKGSSSRRSNPADAFVIASTLHNGTPLTFDGNNRFTDSDKPNLYRTHIAAANKLAALREHFKGNDTLDRAFVRAAHGIETGAVYGARPRRKNPRGKTRGPGKGVKKNPAPRHNAEIEAAAKLQTDFSGHSSENVDTVTVPENKVFTPVGKLAGVLYDTNRDGKDEKYIHRFRRKSRPLLAASSDGTELKILGGGFRFTEAGIVDE